jgi:hypothetical protein
MNRLWTARAEKRDSCWRRNIKRDYHYFVIPFGFLRLLQGVWVSIELGGLIPPLRDSESGRKQGMSG